MERKKSLDPLIRTGLQILYGYQHDDGGWGWWYDDDSDPYQTAWVVFGLAVTAEAGYPVEPDVIENGAGWLKEHLGEMDIFTRAYALYSMAVAGYGDLEAVAALDSEGRMALDPFSLASLALAYHKLGAEEQARDLLALLAVSASRAMVWPTGRNTPGWKLSLTRPHRSTALALDAVQIDLDHPLIPAPRANGAAQAQRLGQHQRLPHHPGPDRLPAGSALRWARPR
jgi:uncharacterized protein YfaS (alpha-2-macroglobulin family)